MFSSFVAFSCIVSELDRSCCRLKKEYSWKHLAFARSYICKTVCRRKAICCYLFQPITKEQTSFVLWLVESVYKDNFLNQICERSPISAKKSRNLYWFVYWFEILQQLSQWFKMPDLDWKCINGQVSIFHFFSSLGSSLHPIFWWFTPKNIFFHVNDHFWEAWSDPILMILANSTVSM